MDERGIRPSFFYVRQLPDLSPKGNYRHLLAPVVNLELGCPGETEKGSDLWVAFRLGRGSYATTVLREFMKAGIDSY